jgi:hypothetical protein
LSPAQFNPDPNPQAFPPLPFDDEEIFGLTTWITRSNLPPSTTFNPDPTPPPASNVFESFYKTNYGVDSVDATESGEYIPARPESIRTREVVKMPQRAQDRYGREPLPKKLELPRTNVVSVSRIEQDFEIPSYPLAARGEGFPKNTVPVTNRWEIHFGPWKRYSSGDTETPYSSPTPHRWHPYEQSLLKGDLPIRGQDIFLNLTAGSQTEFEARRVPLRSGRSMSNPAATESFGQSEQWSFQQTFSFAAELSKGETVFRPADWSIRLEPVLNVKHISSEDEVVSRRFTPSGRLLTGSSTKSSDKTQMHFAFQDASFEYHLRDLSVNYDFLSIKSGIQSFNSDFRGFVFNDSNLGARLFGNLFNNRVQYNLALFDMLEKDTSSDLNAFDKRDQRVFVANVYRQDFLTKGYTVELSLQANLDGGGLHHDRNGNLTRPAPLGASHDHEVRAYYFGWAGHGHIGTVNVSHAFYELVGPY